MSDVEGEGKKGGYRLEYASSARAKCKGPKPCSGTQIGKGELRMGSLVDFKGTTSFSWRHWGCVTAKIITNMKKSFEEADELDGFEDLNEEDQEKVRKAWEEGHVADEDIPETARKPAGEDGDGEESEEKPKKKRGPKKDEKKSEAADGPAVFKVEYASSSRAKCKGCTESIGKDFFRIGQEVDFRGNKSFHYLHWGCLSNEQVAKLKKSYAEPSAVDGFAELKEAEQEKVKRAWEADEIPEEDKGPGEAVDTGKKKAPVKKAKKDDDGAPPKKRARKAKKEEEDELDEDDEEEEKPKRRATAKKAATEKAPARKRAPKKKDVEESGEDFGDEIAALNGDDEDEDEEDSEAGKKRKRAPATKAKSSSSKPASKATQKPASKASQKPASKASQKPASKAAQKPTSRRKQAPVEEDIEEDEDE